MPLLVGLTGSMGSGKSMVAEMLRDLGAHIIDADAICHDLVQPEKPAWREIVEHFGKEVLLENGELNRQKLAKIVFEDLEKKKILERILHPRVFAEERKQFEEVSARDSSAVVIVDAALLIESGNYRSMDKVVLLGCDEEIQIQRLLKRNIWSRDEIVKRLSSQMKLEEKMKLADYFIPNNSTLADLKLHIVDLYDKLKSVA